MKIALLMLCHESPSIIAEALQSPFYADSEIKVYIHYDQAQSTDNLRQLKALLPPGVQVFWLEQRVRCRWGEYSLVEATKKLMESALHDESFGADRMILVSGSCVPIRPAESLRAFLMQFPETEFIEAVDAERHRWVQDGLQQERYQLYFPFNFKSHRRWFERFVWLQKQLGVRRRLPSKLRIHFGSQWFCLTRRTAAHVVSRLNDDRHQRFFKTCWIPDEFVIQTFVAEAVSSTQISGHSLTYYEFDPWGRPMVLDNGHFEHLMAQPFFFARKLAPSAQTLRSQLNDAVSRVEPSNNYFERVGTPTPEYRCYLARATSVKSARGHIGTLEDDWRGVMDRNERAYLVLWSSCLPYARSLIAAAQREAQTDLLILDPLAPPDLPVHKKSPSGETHTPSNEWFEYAPAAALYEFVNSHPTQMSAVLVDTSTDSWLRNFVPWDCNATLVCLDPPHLTKIQRAEAALRFAPRHWNSSLVKSIYHAAFTNAWLPQEHFPKLASEKAIYANLHNLAEVARNTPAQSIHFLARAQKALPEEQFFNTDHLAWLQLRRARPALSKTHSSTPNS
ncbi:beta-1,6-N-acetylglucosaminyltransferase [Ideonella sp.]|jgi:hypothetical protein|uniref:beta-1,6-N-acetylglucosaminyltransferase n=1 Tax=Ideonella sp. TaxID=1929293 RepID=UPI0037C1737C